MMVFSVHNGEVSRVVAIPGFNTTVLIRHGKYLTVYANLIEVEVKQGQKIDAGAKIGRYLEMISANPWFYTLRLGMKIKR